MTRPPRRPAPDPDRGSSRAPTTVSRRSSQLVGTCALAFALLAAWPTTSGRAQQPFRLELHTLPTGPDDGVWLSRPTTIPARALHVQLRTDYTNRPLVVTLRGSSVNEVEIVAHRLAAAFSLAVGVAERVTFYATLPVVLHQSGASVLGLDAPDARGLGDLTLGVNAHLFGGAEGVQLGLGIALTEPTGSSDAFAGDERVGASLQLRLAYVRGPWSGGAAAGVTLRPDREWLTHQSGADMTLVLGAFYTPLEPLRVGLELLMATGLTDGAFFERARTPLEMDASARLALDHGLYVQAAAGLGLVDGVGNPRARVMLSLGWASAAGS